MDTEAMTYWEKVVALGREDFGEKRLAEEATWQAVVLIPKGKLDYLGIGLVEVVWKVVEGILNFAHRLHHLPRLTTQILSMSWYRYRHTRGQNSSAVSGHE